MRLLLIIAAFLLLSSGGAAANTPLQTCYSDGQIITVRGVASAQTITLADGSENTTWILNSMRPVCVIRHDIQQIFDISQFHIIGTPPLAGRPIELSGRLNIENVTQNKDVAIEVISGQHLPDDTSDSDALNDTQPTVKKLDKEQEAKASNDGRIRIKMQPSHAYDKCLLHSIADHNLPAQTFEKCMDIGINLCNKMGIKTDTQTHISAITGTILLSNQQCADLFKYEYTIISSGYDLEVQNCMSYQRIGQPCKPITSPDSWRFECDDKCKESAKSDYDECLKESVINGDNLTENDNKCLMYALTWCDAMEWPTYDHPPYETFLDRVLSGLPIDNRCTNEPAHEQAKIINEFGNEAQKKALLQ